MRENDYMRKSILLMILAAGTALVSCSSLQTISFDQLQAADVSFPNAVRKVAVINNMPVIEIKDDHGTISAEMEGDGKIATEALAENIANVNYFDQVIICDSAFRANDTVPRVNVILTQDEYRNWQTIWEWIWYFLLIECISKRSREYLFSPIIPYL